MEKVDAVVVGAGVIGLAVARALARSGLETLVLEAEARIGTGISARNSEVIHAGLYYPSGSAKARLCVAGRRQLYEFCAARGVPHRRTGKLIMARDATQIAGLEAIAASAAAAGVADLRRLSRQELRALEPELGGVEALLSPSSGIVDVQSLMRALLAEAEASGATLATRAQVSGVSRSGGFWQVHVLERGAAPDRDLTAAVDNGGDPAGDVVDSATSLSVATPRVVNAAGLGAQALARRIDGLDATQVPTLYLARGHYFAYAGRVPFRHLVYPVPEPGGLGTHLTLDLAGRARFGPDVEWIDRVDYSIDPSRGAKFAAAARDLWPRLDPSRLEPAYVGIRPKITGRGEPAADFMISGPAEHGMAGLVNLFGIESPGLTASMALADEVVARLA